MPQNASDKFHIRAVETGMTTNGKISAKLIFMRPPEYSTQRHIYLHYLSTKQNRTTSKSCFYNRYLEYFYEPQLELLNNMFGLGILIILFL